MDENDRTGGIDDLFGGSDLPTESTATEPAETPEERTARLKKENEAARRQKEAEKKKRQKEAAAERKTRLVSFDLPDASLKEALAAEAEARGTSISAIINALLIPQLEAFQRGEIEILSLLTESPSPRFKLVFDYQAYLDQKGT